MAAPTATDAISVEIFANLFQAIVDEMAWIVLRSSHTTFVKETQDFSTGLVTPEGEMFATPYALGAPSLACAPMGPGTTSSEVWEPGDTLITNDPYTTAGMVMHLNDVYLFRPIFVAGRLLCFGWAFIHSTDVGGSAPGSIDMKNYEVFQEGLRLRPVKLHRAGELNQQIWDVLGDNSRVPNLNKGDITALLSALDSAERRIHRLAERRGADGVRDAMYATLDRTERQARAVLRTIPAGSYRFVDYFEDDYVSDLPVRLEVRLVSDGEGDVTLDYRGSDPQVGAALNLPTGGQKRHPFLCLALINFIMTHAPDIHCNAGLIRSIELVLPEDSVVNASFPASCGMRYSTALRCHDLVLATLVQAVPDLIPASGSGVVIITYISTSTLGRQGRVVVANGLEGGSGGGLGMDGISGVSFGAAFIRNVPVEVLESEAPVIVHRFGMRPDTEGAGRFRGGFGMEYALQISHPSAVVVMRGNDRHRFSCWGALGGGTGGVGSTTGYFPDGSTADVGKVTVYRPELGEILHIRIGGGGGLGSPLNRDPSEVARDVEDGLVSAERAAEVYGVALDGGLVDEAGTREGRLALAGTARHEPFDVGQGRRAWEGRFGTVS
ncbi:MAG: hydantoinase B/oxoprolinase family protein, partial [Candidatus Dormiibacterota bacterium]